MNFTHLLQSACQILSNVKRLWWLSKRWGEQQSEGLVAKRLLLASFVGNEENGGSTQFRRYWKTMYRSFKSNNLMMYSLSVFALYQKVSLSFLFAVVIFNSCLSNQIYLFTDHEFRWKCPLWRRCEDLPKENLQLSGFDKETELDWQQIVSLLSRRTAESRLALFHLSLSGVSKCISASLLRRISLRWLWKEYQIEQLQAFSSLQRTWWKQPFVSSMLLWEHLSVLLHGASCDCSWFELCDPNEREIDSNE